MLIGAVSWIAKVGAVELAVGAWLGWVVWMSTDTKWLKKVGIRSPRRIFQAHLDLIIMGILLIAIGTAGPDFPRPWSDFLVIGAWTNALLFLPAAWYDSKPMDFKAIAAQAVSFTLVSVGTLAFAIYLLGQ